MRIFAFLAALAGLVAVVAQVLRIVGANGVEAIAAQGPLLVLVSQWSQLAFIVLVTLFLFIFALSKPTRAAPES